MIAALRQNASYVQTLAATDLPLLLSSGYGAMSTNRTSTPLIKPTITNVDNFQSTKLMLGAHADAIHEDAALAAEVEHHRKVVLEADQRVVSGNLG